MWLHVDSPDYTMAAAGMAVSDRVTGPYRYLGNVRPNGCDSRDLTIFQDDDGRAYLVHSSDWNSVLMVADLADDYLRPTRYHTRHFDHGRKNPGRESPAAFKHDGKYFVITSGTTGWNPNAAEYAVADSVHGPWRVKGNPCVGPDAQLTFRAQDTFVLPMPGRPPGEFILPAERWEPQDLQDSRYVWLPLRVRGEEVGDEWRDEWSPGRFERGDHPDEPERLSLHKGKRLFLSESRCLDFPQATSTDPISIDCSRTATMPRLSSVTEDIEGRAGSLPLEDESLQAFRGQRLA